MAMERSVARVLARQVKLELDSAYFFLQAVNWFDRRFMPGFANWMRKQAHEEVGRALVIFNYINSRKADAGMETVDCSRPDHASLTSLVACARLRVYEIYRATEQARLIAELAEDGEAVSLLDCLVEETRLVAENLGDMERSVSDLDGDAAALAKLDDEFGKRKFVVPVLAPGKRMGKLEMVNAC